MELLKIDFAQLFQLENSISELFLRGSVIYLGILFLMRLLPRRTGGEIARIDLIFIILIAEAAAHSLGEYSFVTEGFIVILTFMAWNFAVNWLSYHVPFIERMVAAPPWQVVKDRKLLCRNMRREYITQEELMDHLRKEGLEDVQQVKAAFAESDGIITVIKKKDSKE